MTSRTAITTRDAHLIAGIMAANASTEVGEIEGSVDLEKLRELRSRRLPFVIRGLGARWAVVRTWTSDRRLKYLAQREEKECPERKYTVYAPDPDGDVNQSDAMPAARMSIAKFLETGPKRGQYLLGVPDKHGRGLSPFEFCSKTDVSERATSRGKSTKVYRPVFASDLDKAGDTSILGDLFGNDCVDSKRHLFFNAAYCYTNCHYDTDWNVYLCARGSRRWTVAHPDQHVILSHNGSARSQYQPTLRRAAGTSSSTCGTRSWHRYSDLVKFITVDLSAGDVLIVPPRWWHVVEGSLPSDGTPRLSAGINWFFTYDYEETYRSSPGDVVNLIGYPEATASTCLTSAVEMMKAASVTGGAAEILEMAQKMGARVSKSFGEIKTTPSYQLLSLAVGYLVAGRDEVCTATMQGVLQKLVTAAVDLSDVLSLSDSRKRKRPADEKGIPTGALGWLPFGPVTRWKL